MNGLTEGAFVFDSCVCMNFLNGKIAELPGKRIISVVTRVELLSKPELTSDEEAKIDTLLRGVSVIPLDDDIEHEAIAIRRFGKPRPKLPDAIIAATAKVLNVPLVTLDEDLLSLSFPGLLVNSIN